MKNVDDTFSHFGTIPECLTQTDRQIEQESPVVADKPARRESMPKIAPIRRAYNFVTDNTGLSSFV